MLSPSPWNTASTGHPEAAGSSPFRNLHRATLPGAFLPSHLVNFAMPAILEVSRLVHKAIIHCDIIGNILTCVPYMVKDRIKCLRFLNPWVDMIKQVYLFFFKLGIRYWGILIINNEH